MPTTAITQVRFRSVGGVGIRLVVVDAGHFVWEEAPTEYASIILGSIQGGRTA